MRKSYLQIPAFVLLSVMFSCNDQKSQYQGEISVIPEPVDMIRGDGEFVINGVTKIYTALANEEAVRIATIFSEQFRQASGLSLPVTETPDITPSGIFFVILKDSLDDEGYHIEVTENHVIVKGSTPAGLFYGMQTLKQLLPAEIESKTVVDRVKWNLPVVSITDYPRYKWRGLHLDVSRHFSSIEFIKGYLDNMAMHKLNTFHWHLTDDQGWRIEIKKYPKLTEIGAWREETLVGHAGSKEFDGKPYGGFYTQEEIKEVVAYAKDRFITVVPEIEMPGHATAAVASYPEIGVTGNTPKVVTEWGVFLDIYGVEDNAFEFLENVLTEVMELFPSEYIHIGGDEAWKDQWKASAKVQAKIKELDLKDEHELQSWFITRIEKFVNSKGRQIIGWDEILEGGLAPNAAVMSWRGEEGGIAAAKQQHKVVMSPGSHLYLDHYQGDPRFEPLQIHGYTTLEKLYSYNPTPDTLTVDEQKYILGAQANVWTEYLPTEDMIEYVVFPRLAAFSEVVWSLTEKRNWEAFKTRVPRQLERYEYRDINYAKSIYYVTYKTEPDSVSGKFRVILENQFGLPGMCYTLDGTEPTVASPLYEFPLALDSGTEIRAGLFENEILMGKITGITISNGEK